MRITLHENMYFLQCPKIFGKSYYTYEFASDIRFNIFDIYTLWNEAALAAVLANRKGSWCPPYRPSTPER